VVILDEAQTLPLPLLRPCVAALDELARNYGASIVLCTATQPALLETDDEDESFKGGLRNVREIAPEPKRLYQTFKRVRVAQLGGLNDDALAARLRDHEQALCIVNTRAHARELYERIKGEDGCYHLSALMCPKHRSARLDTIRAALQAEQRCIVVSTSLVEAGVDVDFPVVYRAEAGLDSIAQAAGRCNREGRLSQGQSSSSTRPGGDSSASRTAAPAWLLASSADTTIRSHSMPSRIFSKRSTGARLPGSKTASTRSRSSPAWRNGKATSFSRSRRSRAISS
jgi:CRISPR-associated endonuclease/helicase Cas3